MRFLVILVNGLYALSPDKFVIKDGQHKDVPSETLLYAKLKEVIGKDGIEGNSNDFPKEKELMNQLAADARVKTICETGFNGGHGTLRWLLHSSPQTHVYSFDFGDHWSSRPAAAFLGESFPGRHTAIWGDSTQTVPDFHSQHPEVKCNLIFVDGGHSEDVARADLQNFMAMADPEYNVVLIDDANCGNSWCAGPTKSWNHMVQQGLVIEDSKFDGGGRGFSLGRYTKPGFVVQAYRAPLFEALKHWPYSMYIIVSLVCVASLLVALLVRGVFTLSTVLQKRFSKTPEPPEVLKAPFSKTSELDGPDSP
jgi:hypothetical protein